MLARNSKRTIFKRGRRVIEPWIFDTIGRVLVVCVVVYKFHKQDRVNTMLTEALNNQVELNSSFIKQHKEISDKLKTKENKI